MLNKEKLFIMALCLLASVSAHAQQDADMGECVADTLICDDAAGGYDASDGTGDDFRRIIVERGLGMSADVSEQDDIVMAQPRCAYVNIEVASGLPSSKGKTVRGVMEFYDGSGIRFRKPVELSVQGGYSVSYPKKNFTCDFAFGDGDERVETELAIGEWVRQDSYHLKAFYTDVLRGIGEIGYELYDRMVADRLPFWQRSGMEGESKARCFPDGFPCALFVNGAFHGVYAWQLKKSRKNMNMKKSCAEHVHLDGNIRDMYLFDGNVSWGQFEVRNPKGLYVMSGDAYNGDKPRELIDEKSKSYSLTADDYEVKEAKVMTAAVKRHILDLSLYTAALKAKETAGADMAVMREEVEKRYDVESLLDYNVLYHFQYNCDGSLKNWQWFTYDGHRWMVTPYDLDQTFGINLYGVVRPATLPMEQLRSGPFLWISKYFWEDLRQRYCQLRQEGVLEADAINAMIDDWSGRVGDELYAMEESRWPESPCFSDVVCSEGWTVSDEWDKYADVPAYSSVAAYRAGDIVRYEGRLWQAAKDRQCVRPCVRNANKDSVGRIKAWVADRLAYLDVYYDYDPSTSAVDGVESSGGLQSHGYLIGIYTLTGEKVAHPGRGVNVYRYSDGTSVKMLVR